MIKLSIIAEKINPRNIEVRPIETDAELSLFNQMIRKHYLQGINKSVNIKLGIFVDRNMIGLAAYGPPTFPLISNQLNLKSNEVYELRRFYTEDNNIHNLESQAISLANIEVKNIIPRLKAIITYADSSQGHQGTLYQATNAIYLGKSRGISGKHKYVYILGSKSEKRNTEKQMNLKSEPYPKKELQMEFVADGFNMDEFINIRSYNGKIRYAERYLSRISQGTARMIFDIDGKTVLKLAKNDKGIAQNEIESMIGQDKYFDHIVAKVLETEDNYKWIVSEKANRITKNRFKQLSDGISINIVYKYLVYILDPQRAKWLRLREDFTEEELDSLSENQFVEDFLELCSSYKLELGDFDRISSYGEIDGRLVVVDYGLTFDVFNKYYNSR